VEERELSHAMIAFSLRNFFIVKSVPYALPSPHFGAPLSPDVVFFDSHRLATFPDHVSLS